VENNYLMSMKAITPQLSSFGEKTHKWHPKLNRNTT